METPQQDAIISLSVSGPSQVKDSSTEPATSDGENLSGEKDSTTSILICFSAGAVAVMAVMLVSWAFKWPLLALVGQKGLYQSTAFLNQKQKSSRSFQVQFTALNQVDDIESADET